MHRLRGWQSATKTFFRDWHFHRYVQGYQVVSKYLIVSCPTMQRLIVIFPVQTAIMCTFLKGPCLAQSLPLRHELIGFGDVISDDNVVLRFAQQRGPKKNGKSPYLISKSTINGPFSVAKPPKGIPYRFPKWLIFHWESHQSPETSPGIKNCVALHLATTRPSNHSRGKNAFWSWNKLVE